MSDNYKDTDLQEHESPMVAFALAGTQPLFCRVGSPSSLTSHRNPRQLYDLLSTLLCRSHSLQALQEEPVQLGWLYVLKSSRSTALSGVLKTNKTALRK